MIVIRQAKILDARSIAEIHVASWRETYPGIISDVVLQKMSVNEREASWAERLQGESGPLWVAADGEKVVGFAFGGPHRLDASAAPGVDPQDVSRFSAELYALYLLKGYQGQGLGRALFEAICSSLAATGHSNLLVWVLEKNPTKDFYAHLAGRPVAKKTIEIGVPLEEIAFGFEKI